MSQFRNREEVTERFRNNPDQIVTLVEGVLSDQQVASIEVALFPQPSVEERKKALEAARRVLVRAGIQSDDPALLTLESEIAAVEVAAQ